MGGARAFGGGCHVQSGWPAGFFFRTPRLRKVVADSLASPGALPGIRGCGTVDRDSRLCARACSSSLGGDWTADADVTMARGDERF